MQLGLAGVVLALTTLGGLGTTAWLQQRSARLGRIDVALKEAELLSDQAAADTAEVSGKWQEARLGPEAVGRPARRDKLRRRMARVAGGRTPNRRGCSQAHFDQALIGRLETVRFRREHRLAEAGEPGNWPADAQTEIDYEALFREADLDPTVSTRPTGNGVSPAVPRNWLSRLLPPWTTGRPSAAGTAGDESILAINGSSTPLDPSTRTRGERPRKALSARDKETLVRLANDPKLTDQPPPSLDSTRHRTDRFEARRSRDRLATASPETIPGQLPDQ